MSSFEQNIILGQEPLAQQLYIETPEQVALQFAVAGIGSRFVAILLDHIIVIGTLIVEILLFAWIGSSVSGKPGAHTSDTMQNWIIGIVIFLNFCLVVGYFALFESYWHGQTPGKRVMKLRVIKDSGRQITFFEALARNLLRLVDYLPSLYLTGVITMICNKRCKRLGDFAAGTIVVHEAREEVPMLPQHNAFLPAAANTWQDPVATATFPADAVARLAPSDLVMIDTFFARALDLNLDVRAGMAQRMAEQLAAKMGVALPEGNPERMLESIAVMMRGSGTAGTRS